MERKILIELTYEEVKNLEMLLEVIEYVSEHGSLPHATEIKATKGFPWYPVASVDKSELAAQQKIELAKMRKLREKLKTAIKEN